MCQPATYRFPFAAVALLLASFASASFAAGDKQFNLSAPPALVETGFLKFLLPRFSLKHGIRVTITAPDNGPPAILDRPAPGTVPVFAGAGTTYFLVLPENENGPAARFKKWLISDIGKSAITGFSKEGQPRFTPASAVVAQVEIAVRDGDAARGEKLSMRLCGRCHVVSEENRMKGIDSTPSFFALRSLKDWMERFDLFYLRNPHPAFTQLDKVSEPFVPSRPSPIQPLRMSTDDLENILAYVSKLEPADLGAPVRHQ